MSERTDRFEARLLAPRPRPPADPAAPRGAILLLSGVAAVAGYALVTLWTRPR